MIIIDNPYGYRKFDARRTMVSVNFSCPRNKQCLRHVGDVNINDVPLSLTEIISQYLDGIIMTEQRVY